MPTTRSSSGRVDGRPYEEMSLRKGAHLSAFALLLTTLIAPPAIAGALESASNVPSAQMMGPPSPTPGGVQNAAPSDLSIRVNALAPLKLTTNAAPWWTYWIPAIGPVISGLLAFFGVSWGLKIAQKNADKTARLNEAILWQKANENEIDDINEKLNSFYGPLIHLLETDHLMAREFRARQTDENYRMLVYVFDRDWLNNLSQGDKQIVEQVCNMAAEIEDFIRKNAGLVDNKIMPYLARASAHFRMLHLAYKGALGTDATHFKRYVYPQQLDSVLGLEVARLRARCDELRASQDVRLAPMKPLQIGEEFALEIWPNPKRGKPA